MNQRSTLSSTVLLGVLCVALSFIGSGGTDFPGPPAGWMTAITPLIAGLTVLLLVLFSLRFVNMDAGTPEGLLLALLLLFNPAAGVEHTGSIADLSAAAIGIGVLSLTIRDDSTPEDHLQIGLFLIGILVCLAPWTLPFIILPGLIAFGRARRKGRAALAFLAPVAALVLPSTFADGYSVGFHNLVRDVSNVIDTVNRTANGFPAIELKRLGFLRNVVVKGLGAYWPGGSPVSIVVSLGLVLCFARGAWWMFYRETDGLVITIACITIYVASLLMYANVPGTTRSILPLLPLLLFPVWAGAVQLMRSGWRGRTVIIFFLCAYVVVGSGLAQ